MRNIYETTTDPQADTVGLISTRPMPDHLALPLILRAGAHRDVAVLEDRGRVVGLRGPHWALNAIRADVERLARAEAARPGSGDGR